MIGQVFGRYTVLAAAPARGGRRYWLCRCVCGVEKEVRGDALKSRNAQSCGCLADDYFKGHRTGATGPDGKITTTYSRWAGMRKRCLNPNDTAYRFYGARGVRVCDRWNSYRKNFLADMGECPDGLTLERVDVAGNYEPGNCKWATWTEQHRNKRTSVLTESIVGQIKRRLADGQRPCEVAKELVVSAASVSAIANGKQWVNVPAAACAGKAALRELRA